MKTKRRRKRWAWKNKHLLKHYLDYNLSHTEGLVCIIEDGDKSWELWKIYTRYKNAPKDFRRTLENSFKSKSKEVTRKKFADYEHEDDYLHPVFKKDASWYYW